jgi:acetate kinase
MDDVILVADNNRLVALGHRVLDGGSELSRPTLISPLVPTVERFIPLALLHQPHNLVPIRIAAQ